MAVSAKMVKELRDRTGAGMLDCKNALQENSGDFDKSTDWLRKKGISKAGKKAGRITAEGSVSSYIHGNGKIGVLLEVNSETDFVAKTENFLKFTRGLSMHIAASNPLAVSKDDIPTEKVDAERTILTETNRESGKKEEMIERIVEGQMKKWLAENCLLEQKFVLNPDITVGDHVKATIGEIGENLVVRRFSRFELGEGIEKKIDNFAAEVAAQAKQ